MHQNEFVLSDLPTTTTDSDTRDVLQLLTQSCLLIQFMRVWLLLHKLLYVCGQLYTGRRHRLNYSWGRLHSKIVMSSIAVYVPVCRFALHNLTPKISTLSPLSDSSTRVCSTFIMIGDVSYALVYFVSYNYCGIMGINPVSWIYCRITTLNKEKGYIIHCMLTYWWPNKLKNPVFTRRGAN